MEKSKIDWCDSTWNPVTGCLHGCDYCYARSITHRFGCHATPDTVCPELAHAWEDSETGRKLPYPYDFHPTLHTYRLMEYRNKRGRNIFVCSMADLFGSWVPDSWLDNVFAACIAAPQHNYLFLTKNVGRYCKYSVFANDNMWYGITIANESDVSNFNFMPAGCKTFVSMEPLLEDLLPAKHNILFRQVDWIIIGAETGKRNNKVIPKRKWIKDIVEVCKMHGTPVFMKSSLADIWGEPLIRQFPEQFKKDN